MKLNRSSRVYRLVAGFILPPFFGAILFLMITMVEQLYKAPLQYEAKEWLIIFVPIAFAGAMVFVGIQSLICSLTMEFIVRPRLTRRKSFLVAGGLLGFLAALPLLNPAFFSIGIVVGIVVGLLIYQQEH